MICNGFLTFSYAASAFCKIYKSRNVSKPKQLIYNLKVLQSKTLVLHSTIHVPQSTIHVIQSSANGLQSKIHAFQSQT